MTLTERITNYLEAGGLFNPEMMDHQRVRDLLMACRDEIQSLKDQIECERKCAEQAIWEAQSKVQ